MEKQSYEEFTEKFKPKKTTDDCYTPAEIYDTVAEYVENTYSVKRENFVRPFYPGEDYENYDYKQGDIVVDNPPFSIFSKIVRFYAEKGIKFFLFAPQLTMLQARVGQWTFIVVDGQLIYENGAKVKTGFITNLEDEYIIRSDPELSNRLKEANEAVQKTIKRQIPKYKYPNNVVTTSMMNYIGNHGISYGIRKGDGVFIGLLDAQKKAGKTIFGGGLLVSEKAAAEKAAAEKAAAEKTAAEKTAAEKAAAIVWELSDREKEIIKEMERTKK